LNYKNNLLKKEEEQYEEEKKLMHEIFPKIFSGHYTVLHGLSEYSKKGDGKLLKNFDQTIPNLVDSLKEYEKLKLDPILKFSIEELKRLQKLLEEELYTNIAKGIDQLKNMQKKDEDLKVSNEGEQVKCNLCYSEGILMKIDCGHLMCSSCMAK
jgi:hypothetical protein